MKPAALLILVLSLGPAARAGLPADGAVEDPGRPTDDDKLQKGTFACLMLSDPDCGATSNATPILSAPGPVAAPIFTWDARAFQKLLSSYPQGSVDDLRVIIGRPAETWISNTCAIRVSYAMNEAGFVIDHAVQDQRSLTDPNGKINFISDRSGVRNGRYYVYRVDEFARYMLKKYGKPQIWGKGDKKGGDDLRRAVQGRKGVILFVVKSWSDATGHFDLWDGSKASHDDYFSVASDVFLWQ
jgi:hypothetical protein